MGKIKITLVKSAIHRPKNQKATLVALGLSKLNESVEKETNPQLLGMVKKVQHLLAVQEI